MASTDARPALKYAPPPISYEDALSLSICGKSIRHMSTSEFSTILEWSLMSADLSEKAKAKIKQQLAGADLSHKVDRWWVICTLIESGVLVDEASLFK